jgi:cephalosporin hydroxylase
MCSFVSDVVSDSDKEASVEYEGFGEQTKQMVNNARASLQQDQRRFVDFFSRKHRSDLGRDAIKALSRGKYLMHWQDVEVMKDPLDLLLYQQLLWELKPQTIVELGAYAGGTAIWMGDLLQSYGSTGHIYSVDIDLSLLHDAAKAHPRVTFMQGDLAAIAQVFPPGWLAARPHPWLVIEDVHVHVVESLSYFDAWMQAGDYFIIEDTNPEAPAISGMGLDENLGYEPYGTEKLDELRAFMDMHSAAYRVDAYYTDMFGYNGTWNWHGFIKKIA